MTHFTWVGEGAYPFDPDREGVDESTHPDEARWSAVSGPDATELVAAVERTLDAGDIGPSDIARWRRKHDQELVRTAIELAEGRRSLRGRQPDAAILVADRAGAEQATDAETAAWKARHLAASGITRVVDLGCGIGGDAMGVAATAGIGSLRLVDRDPGRAVMAVANAGIASIDRPPGSPPIAIERMVADIADPESPVVPSAPDDEVAVLLDPARRDEASGRRRHALEDAEPGPETVARVLARVRHVALKAGPGTDPDGFPVAEDGRRTIEYVARGNRLVQAVGWYGALATPDVPVRATRLPEQWTIGGQRDHPGSPFGPPPPSDSRRWFDKPPAFLLVPDPVVERARLVGAAWGDGPEPTELAAGLGVYASDAPASSPWFESWAIAAVRPWRIESLRVALRERDAGEVVVRTRGGAVDPDAASRELRGSGDRRQIVFGLRLGERLVAFIADADAPVAGRSGD